MKYLKDIEKFVENKVVFCGIDVHERDNQLCYFCDGEVLERVVVGSEAERIISHTRKTYGNAKLVRFVYEAGFSGFHIYRKLVSSGYDCTITPPSRIPRMGDKVKTDKRDAMKLARFHSGGLLKHVWVPPLRIESDRQYVRLRGRTVKKLSRVKGQIKSHLKLEGKKWSKEEGGCWTRRYMFWLEGLEFSDESFRLILDEYILEYQFLRNRIAELTRRIKELSKREAYRSQYKLLTSCRGVGLITAMTFLLEIWDMSRFHSTEAFGSYIGMTPSQHSSGSHVRLGHITREGNSRVRKVLVECAWTVIRYDPFLRDKYLRIKSKGSNGKKAIVAVARSLAIRLRSCLLNEENYVIGVC
jgi:transposase